MFVNGERNYFFKILGIFIKYIVQKKLVANSQKEFSLPTSPFGFIDQSKQHFSSNKKSKIIPKNFMFVKIK